MRPLVWGEQAAKRLVGVALGVVLISCSSPPAERRAIDAAWSIDDARVLFTGRRDGAPDLFSHDRSTGATRRLTSLGTADGGANAARVSPDGRRVAFQVRRGSDYEIHLMDLSGSESRNVTNHPEYDVSPVWSPDGARLAFMSTRGYELGGIGPFPGHIYVLDLGTGALRRVTEEPLTSSLGPSDWSPDGKALLMARTLEGRPDVFELDLEQGAEARLTSARQGEYSATYAHSGARIAFHSDSGAESQLVVLDLTSGQRTAVTSGPGFRYYPRWSPDDEWLLFSYSESGEEYDVRAVRISDGAVIDIVATEDDEREGAWLRPR